MKTREPEIVIKTCDVKGCGRRATEPGGLYCAADQYRWADLGWARSLRLQPERRAELEALFREGPEAPPLLPGHSHSGAMRCCEPCPKAGTGRW